MKKHSKILALLLAVCLLASALSMPAAAQDVVLSAQASSFDIFSPLQWDMRLIGMAEGRRSGLTGKGVRVAIIDSGVSTRTKEFGNRLLAGENLLDGTQNTNDTDGHGTFIAGIIGAEKGNFVGIAGMAPGAAIVPIKTTGKDKSLASVTAEGIRLAVDKYGCGVISLSFGAKKESDALHDAIRYAAAKGAIVVCSTGNDGTEELYYPGAYEETIGVGSVNRSSRVSSFSHRNTSIFVTAPGENIVSLSRYAYLPRIGSGTSYSVPFVSGLAALLKERYPQMNKDAFAEILKASCKDLGDAGYDTAYGWGLIQVPQAISAADAYFGQAKAAAPQVSSAANPIERILFGSNAA